MLQDDIRINDPDAYSNYLAHTPAGTSMNAMIHLMQIYQSHEMRYFDYGAEQNEALYGQDVPPVISFDNVNGIPMLLINANTDRISDYNADSNNFFLDRNLGPIVYNGTYFYNHFSFFSARDMTYLDDLYSVLQDYQPTLISSA